MKYKVKPLKPLLEKYLQRLFLEKKWEKVKIFLESNITHPSLNFEKIILKNTVFYSFRLDKKYRGICILDDGFVEVIMFTNHYR